MAAALSSDSPTGEYYIYEIPMSKRRELSLHLDRLDAWLALAQQMQFSPDQMESIKRDCEKNNRSPCEELIIIWGHQYNHTVTELFVLFYRLRLYSAMVMIKEFVSSKHLLRLPNNQIAAKSGVKEKEAETPLLSNSDNNLVSSKNDNLNVPIEEKKPNNNEIGAMASKLESMTVSGLISESNVRKYASSIPEINYQELVEATNHWDDAQILGKGGFGKVFWGYWKYTEVAIKQLHYRSARSGRDAERVQIEQSLNELRYLNSCRHDNILPLYGYSLHGEFPCLVYQLMKGGSLERRLYPKTKCPSLTFQQLLNIALGTARGINFLHTLREKPLIHGDIKPANILLDQCLLPKIGDFGLAREGPQSINTTVQVTQVFGTKPYLPPEFLDLRSLSTQVDTFSFGVVLLEMFTGLRVMDNNRMYPLLTKHILHMHSLEDFKSRLQALVEMHFPGLSCREDFICKQIVHWAIKCIATDPLSRPNMGQTLRELNKFYMCINPANPRNTFDSPELTSAGPGNHP